MEGGGGVLLGWEGGGRVEGGGGGGVLLGWEARLWYTLLFLITQICEGQS